MHSPVVDALELERVLLRAPLSSSERQSHTIWGMAAWLPWGQGGANFLFLIPVPVLGPTLPYVPDYTSTTGTCTRYVWAVYGTLKFSTTENLRCVLLASRCSDRGAVFSHTLTTRPSVYESNRELLKPS